MNRFCAFLLVLLVGLGLTAGQATAAKKKPDLVVTSLTDPPSVAAPGDEWQVDDTTKNKGKRSAKASATGFFLSDDQVWDDTDIVFAQQREVPKLGKKKSSSGTGTDVTVPSVPDGDYFLIACADVNENVREKRETNNCRPTDSVSAIATPTFAVESASSTSPTTVVVTFSDAVDPGTVVANGSQFVFDNGLTASAASASGNEVTVTTSVQTPSTNYLVTVANTVENLDGAQLGTPAAAAFTGFALQASLQLSELNANVTGGRDLLELKAVSSGSVDGIKVMEYGPSPPETLVTLPAMSMAAGDIVVIHLDGFDEPGAAPGSEVTSKNQYPTASFAPNYDTAWDILSADAGIANTDRILAVERSDGTILDATPFTNNDTTSTAAFKTSLLAIQAAAEWLPADCAGVACTDLTVPTASDISVPNLNTTGTTPSGSSLQRTGATDTNAKENWSAPFPHTFGVPN